MTKRTPRPPVPWLPLDWWNRTPDELVLDAPGKMGLHHTVCSEGFEVQLSIVTGEHSMVTFHARGATYRDGIRKVEDAAIEAGFAYRKPTLRPVYPRTRPRTK